jgi:hypothetical protein
MSRSPLLGGCLLKACGSLLVGAEDTWLILSMSFRICANRRVTFNSESASYIASSLVGSPVYFAVINVSACRRSLMYVSLHTHKSSLMLQRNIILVFVSGVLVG